MGFNLNILCLRKGFVVEAKWDYQLHYIVGGIFTKVLDCIIFTEARDGRGATRCDNNETATTAEGKQV